MKAIINLLISLLITILFASCDKTSDDKKSIVTCYDETKGSDPWIKGDNDSILIFNVKQYLIADTIAVNEVSISNDGTFETCKAAYCKTGRRIKVIINSNDLEKIQKLRFYECN